MIDGHDRPPVPSADDDVTGGIASDFNGLADTGVASLLTGTLLDDRYMLGYIVHTRGPVTLYHGDDQILARAVAVRVIDHGGRGGSDEPDASGPEPLEDQAADQLLAAAISSGRLVHPGAASTYDATTTETDAGRVSYVVSEWVDGTTLQSMLTSSEPLRPAHAAGIVLTVARVIATAHARGISHGDLHPGDVIIAEHGAVKVTDTEVGAAVARLTGQRPDLDIDKFPDPRERDVRALGALLYAALTGRWPLDGRRGLPAAPTNHDGTMCTPRQVRAGVPRELDALTLAALDDHRSHRAAVRTAADMVAELEAIAPGEQTIDPGLIRVDDDRGDTTRVVPSATPAGGYQPAGYNQAGGYQPSGTFTPTAGYDRGGYQPTGGYQPPGGYPGTGGYPSGGGYQTAPREVRGDGGRKFLVPLIAVVAVAVAIVAIVALRPKSNGSGTPTPTNSQTTSTPVAFTPTSVTAFDPPPGDGKEGDDSLAGATKTDPNNPWHTEYYNTANFGNLKKGVGIRIDFGKPVAPTKIKFTIAFGATSLEVHAGDAAGAGITDYPLVGTPLTDQTGVVSIPVTSTTPHQYWIIWLTKLPAYSGQYEGGISGLSFTGAP